MIDLSSGTAKQCFQVLSKKGFSVDEVTAMCLEILQPMGTEIETDHNIQNRRLGPAIEDETRTGFSRFLSFDDWVSLTLAIVCVIGAALAAGLTVSTVSLRPIDLRVKCRTGTPSEQASAAKLLPLVSIVPRHRLLVTLLLCNSVFNEALPTFLDDLVPTWAAILLSVTAVLFFGEIIPSAIFTGPKQLDIAASFANFLWMVLYVLAPIAYPISAVLDRLVPEEESTMSRNEVRALVEIHREIAQEEGLVEPFNEDEEDMVRGALSLSLMKADNADILKPKDRLFTLPLDGVMDEKTMQLVLDQGYSRVPIMHPKGVLIGYFLVKQLILLDPKEETPISELERYKPVCCSSSTTLSHLLNEFQEGFSHMAFVSKNPDLLSSALDVLIANPTKALNDYEHDIEIKNALKLIDQCDMIGMMTLEDVIEVLLTEKVYDETDNRRRSSSFVASGVGDKHIMSSMVQTSTALLASSNNPNATTALSPTHFSERFQHLPMGDLHDTKEVQMMQTSSTSRDLAYSLSTPINLGGEINKQKDYMAIKSLPLEEV